MLLALQAHLLLLEAELLSARREIRGLRRRLQTDRMTGLGNRDAFERARRTAETPSVSWVVADLDNLRTVNCVSHADGDIAIRHAGRAIRRALVGMGLPQRAFRFGGDEFAVLVPNGKAAVLAAVLERASEITVSLVNTKLTAAAGATFEEADAALMRKKEKRNQC